MASFNPEVWADPDVETHLDPDAPLELGAAQDSESVSVHSSSHWEAVTALGTTFRGVP